MIVHIWPIRSWIPAQARNIRPHAHDACSIAVRAHLSCWAFWSRASVIHVQGTIS